MWTVYAILSPNYPHPCILVVDGRRELRCYGPCIACLIRWLRSIGETHATIHFAVDHEITTSQGADLSEFSATHLTSRCRATPGPAGVGKASDGGPALVDLAPPANRRERRQLEADQRRHAKHRRIAGPADDDIPG